MWIIIIAFTVGKQVLDQLLMSTETCIIPEDKDRERYQAEASLQHTADNTSPSEQSYRGVLSHLSLMFSSTSLCSTRYLEKKRQITTNIIIKHIEHHTRTQPAEYSKYSMCANTVTTYYLSDAHAVPPNSEATLGDYFTTLLPNKPWYLTVLHAYHQPKVFEKRNSIL